MYAIYVSKVLSKPDLLIHFVGDTLQVIFFCYRFCPSIFIFTITEIPCFWLLRLQLVDCVQNNLRFNNGITCSTSINGTNPFGEVWSRPILNSYITYNTYTTYIYNF